MSVLTKALAKELGESVATIERLQRVGGVDFTIKRDGIRKKTLGIRPGNSRSFEKEDFIGLKTSVFCLRVGLPFHLAVACGLLTCGFVRERWKMGKKVEFWKICIILTEKRQGYIYFKRSDDSPNKRLSLRFNIGEHAKMEKLRSRPEILEELPPEIDQCPSIEIPVEMNILNIPEKIQDSFTSSKKSKASLHKKILRLKREADDAI